MTNRSELAIIMHVDVVGSTALVQQDEASAHRRLALLFRRVARVVRDYGGVAHEIRGDALVASFERPSDAVCAALTFQQENLSDSKFRKDSPVSLRVGIAIGEVIIADGTVTGGGVVLAQRLEQLANPGGVVVHGAAHEIVPKRIPISSKPIRNLQLKGFAEPVTAYVVSPRSGAELPKPARQWPLIRAIRKPNLSTRVVVGTTIAAVLMVGTFLLSRYEGTAVPPRVAVLPFETFGDSEEQEYFGQGLSDDIITDLAKHLDIAVLGSNSSFQYAGQTVPLQKVATDLDVRYVVQGTIRRTGDSIRINARLYDSQNDQNIWGERYDLPFSDVVDIQIGISSQIVAALGVTPARKNNLRVRTSNADAYDLYLLAREKFSQKLDLQNAKSALTLFEAAAELDPTFAEAHAWVGRAALWLARFNVKGMFAKAKTSTERALTLDPELAWAHNVRGRISRQNSNFESALVSKRLAVSLAPSTPALRFSYAFELAVNGKASDASRELDKGLMLQPRPPVDELIDAGFAAYFAEDYELAERLFTRALHWTPRGLHDSLAAVYKRQGRRDEAARAMANHLKQSPSDCIAHQRLIWGDWPPAALDQYLGDLSASGLPNWPDVWPLRERDRLTEPQIRNEVLDRVLLGYRLPNESHRARIELRSDKTWSVEQKWTKEKYVGSWRFDGSAVCQRSERVAFGREYCTHFYRGTEVDTLIRVHAYGVYKLKPSRESIAR